jgi:predicted porin
MAAAVAAVVSAPAMAAEWKINEDTKFAVNVDLFGYFEMTDKVSAADTTVLEGEGSEVEFKASHKLNDDVKVFGEMEIVFDGFETSDTVETDDIKFGFEHKNFGKITIGQFDPYFEDKIAEGLDFNFGESTTLTEAKTDDPYGHIQYLKKMGDVTFAVDLNFSEDSSNDDNDWGKAVTVQYKMGAVDLAVGYNDLNTYENDGTSHSDDTTAGAVLNYKVSDNTKLTAMYTTSDSTSNVTTDIMGVGLKQKMGDLELRFAIQDVDPENSTSRTEWFAGAQYELYKDFRLFVDYTDFDGASLKVNSDTAAATNSALSAGVHYSF